jgi:hypothetical protein
MHSKTWAVWTAVVLVSACSNDFAPYSRLDRLRVLAIRANPPTPVPGDLCRMEALAFAPAAAPIAYRWSFCPVLARANEDYACPLTQAETVEVFGASPPFDLGTARTAEFTNPFALDRLGALCAAGVHTAQFDEAVNCGQGYPVSLVLDVSTDGDSLRAAFTVYLPTSADAAINANPTVLDLALDGQILAEEPTPVPLPAGRVADLAVALSDDSAEMRPIPPSESGSGLRRERLRLSWFADLGSLDQDRTVYLDGETTLQQATSNRWTPPPQEALTAQALGTFAVVVRDDRGGVGWLTRPIDLGPQP